MQVWPSAGRRTERALGRTANLLPRARRRAGLKPGPLALEAMPSASGLWANLRGEPAADPAGLAFPRPSGWSSMEGGSAVRQMIEILSRGEECLVVAFPGGLGTSVLVEAARAMSIRVIEITGFEEPWRLGFVENLAARPQSVI